VLHVAAHSLYEGVISRSVEQYARQSLQADRSRRGDPVVAVDNPPSVTRYEDRWPTTLELSEGGDV
jgi:hypothetical protein